MKYLGEPEHDDFATLRAMSINKKLNSFPQLGDAISRITDRYRLYSHWQGNACRMREPLVIEMKLAGDMKTHYESKPGDLIVIDSIRDKFSPDVCPMCGSPNVGQVDHVAPKDRYPEYSFFTKNLVPACNCNNKKGISFRGKGKGQRILHPYYDKIMQERLVFLKLDGNLDSPIRSIDICPQYLKNAAVQFHVENILRKTNILNWALVKWNAILRLPKKMFPQLLLCEENVTADLVARAVESQLHAKDEEYGTPNNWFSILYEGILRSPGATEYIAKHINDMKEK